MFKLMAVAKKQVANENGAALVEYVLLVALIAALAVVSVTALGARVSSLFNLTDMKIVP